MTHSSTFIQPKKSSPKTLLLMQTAGFFIVFFVLQTLWTSARGTVVERIVIQTMTVKTATVMINLLTPQANATAVTTSISAPNGGINILNGCEGTDALFLLIAAIVVSGKNYVLILKGVIAGTLFVFALNQVRIMTLFYANQQNRKWFDVLHGTVAPLFLIAAASLFFYGWILMANHADARR